MLKNGLLLLIGENFLRTDILLNLIFPFYTEKENFQLGTVFKGSLPAQKMDG